MGNPELAAPAAEALKMRIEGMDCSACALKIENALKRLRGVSDVSVNYGIETLTLRIDQDRISLGAVEQQIRALGYAPKVLDSSRAFVSKGEENIDARPWLRSRQGRRVVGTGSALVVAWLIAQLD